MRGGRCDRYLQTFIQNQDHGNLHDLFSLQIPYTWSMQVEIDSCRKEYRMSSPGWLQCGIAFIQANHSLDLDVWLKWSMDNTIRSTKWRYGKCFYGSLKDFWGYEWIVYLKSISELANTFDIVRMFYRKDLSVLNNAHRKACHLSGRNYPLRKTRPLEFNFRRKACINGKSHELDCLPAPLSKCFWIIVTWTFSVEWMLSANF